MIRIGIGQLAAAALLILNAIALDDAALRFIDLVAAAWLIYSAFERIDPPSTPIRV